MLQHVWAEHRHGVHAQAGAGGEQQGDVAGGPPDQALDGPFDAALPDAQPGPHVTGLEEDRAHAEDEVQAEHGEVTPDTRRLGEGVAQQYVLLREVNDLLDRRRDAAQGDGDADGGGHDEDLQCSEADERLALSVGGFTAFALAFA